MKSKSVRKLSLLLILLIVMVAIDQITKYMATAFLMGKPFVIIDGVFELHYLDGGNTGAAWGIFAGNIGMFIVISAFISILLVVLIIKMEFMILRDKSLSRKYGSIQFFMTTLLAGALGNMIDRIVNQYVVDFLYFKLIDFPIFNVADCYATVSAFMLIILFQFYLSDEEFYGIFSRRKLNDKGVTNEIKEDNPS